MALRGLYDRDRTRCTRKQSLLITFEAEPARAPISWDRMYIRVCENAGGIIHESYTRIRDWSYLTPILTCREP